MWINDCIGIESFNGKGHYNGELFIGLVDFKRERKVQYKHHIWLENSIQKIWSKDELFKQLQNYANGDDEQKDFIIQEISNKIEEFVELSQ